MRSADPIKAGILKAYDELADGVTATAGLAGEDVRKVPVEWVRNAVRDMGFLDTKEGNGKGALTAAASEMFRRAKVDLISRNRLVERGGMVWRIWATD